MNVTDLLLSALGLYVLRITYRLGCRRTRRAVLEGHRRELVEERDHYLREATGDYSHLAAARYALVNNRLAAVDAMIEGNWRRAKSCKLKHLALRAKVRGLEAEQRQLHWVFGMREAGPKGARERALN